MSEEIEIIDFEITAEETLVGDLVSYLLQEVKAMPKPWQALGEIQQQEVIDRFEKGVTTAVGKAMQYIATEGCEHLRAEVEQVVFKDGMKAVLKPMASSPLRHQLSDSVNQFVSIVFSDPENRLGKEGMPTPERAQQELNIEEDELFDEAIGAVRASGRATISFVQRKLRIGYNRAAHMIERMEALGIISAIQSTGVRDVITQEPQQEQTAPRRCRPTKKSGNDSDQLDKAG